MIPFEFVVEGTPISLQTNNAQAKLRWKEKVSVAASIFRQQGDIPSVNNLQVTIIYFYDKIAVIDVDNMLKPIIDALIGLVYFDDRQVTDVIGRKRNIYENYVLEEISPLISEFLAEKVQFVYVLIEIAPDPRSLK